MLYLAAGVVNIGRPGRSSYYSHPKAHVLSNHQGLYPLTPTNKTQSAPPTPSHITKSTTAHRLAALVPPTTPHTANYYKHPLKTSP